MLSTLTYKPHLHAISLPLRATVMLSTDYYVVLQGTGNLRQILSIPIRRLCGIGSVVGARWNLVARL
jgi:hypothetical protein